QRKMALVKPSHRILALLKITKLDTIFKIFDSREAAMQHLTESAAEIKERPPPPARPLFGSRGTAFRRRCGGGEGGEQRPGPTCPRHSLRDARHRHMRAPIFVLSRCRIRDYGRARSR